MLSSNSFIDLYIFFLLFNFRTVFGPSFSTAYNFFMDVFSLNAVLRFSLTLLVSVLFFSSALYFVFVYFGYSLW